LSKKIIIQQKSEEKPEQTWENPANPEQPKDSRDEEQLMRQKKEAERRKDNLNDTPEKEGNN